MADDMLPLMGWPRSLEESEGRVLYALHSYQIIEMTLKLYLINLSPSNLEPSLGVKRDSVINCSLTQLINKFEKINNNKELHYILRDSVDGRNRVAHQALVAQYSNIEKIGLYDKLELKDLRKIDRLASKVMTKLVIEFLEKRTLLKSRCEPGERSEGE